MKSSTEVLPPSPVMVLGLCSTKVRVAWALGCSRSGAMANYELKNPSLKFRSFGSLRVSSKLHDMPSTGCRTDTW